MNKFTRKTLVIGLLAASAGVAHASCSSLVPLYQSYLASYGPNDPLTIYYYNDALAQGCFGTPGAVGQSVVQGTSVQQVFSIFNAISSRPGSSSFGPSGLKTGQVESLSGVAAGGPASKWNAWASGGNTTQRYSGGGVLGAHFNSDVMNMVVGGDYQVTPSIALGASAAFDNGDTRILNNSLNTTGYAVAPYLSWQINNAWSLDGTLGWGEGETKSGANTTDSRRYFSGANLAYTQWKGDWQYSGKASLIHASERSDDTRAAGVAIAGTGNKNKLTQFRLGAQVGYWANGVMPYVGLAWAQDTSRTEQINNPWDKSALVLTAGVNFVSIKDNVTGGFMFTTEQGRRDAANYSWMANINLRF